MHQPAGRHSPRSYVGRAAVAAALAGAALASAPGPSLAGVARPAASVHFRARNINVGAGSVQASVDPNTRTAWVTAGRLVRINEITQRVSAKINVGYGPTFVAIDPGRHAVWTTCSYGLCALTEVSEKTNKVTHQVSGLGTVSGIAVDPRTGLVWLATVDSAHHNVALAVSETTRRVVHTIRLQFAPGRVVGAITADAGSRTVWVSGIPCSTCRGLDSVAEISEAAHRVVHVYNAGGGISTSVVTAVDSRRGTAWLVVGGIHNPGGIEVVSIARRRIIRTIQTASPTPAGIAIDSRAGLVVVTAFGGVNVNTVAVLKESTGALVGQLSVGFYPSLLAVDSGTGNVYVPVDLDKTVTEFHL